MNETIEILFNRAPIWIPVLFVASGLLIAAARKIGILSQRRTDPGDAATQTDPTIRVRVTGRIS